MDHVQIINRVTSELRDKNLFTRAMGKFYTPGLIAERLATHLLSQVDFTNLENFSLIDPFCGDGRLIVAFLNQANKHHSIKHIKWHIAFWDYDDDALVSAKNNIETLINSLGLEAIFDCLCRDSFLALNTEYGLYDCVLTNPPWKTLKPDSREMVGLSAAQKTAYRNALKSYDRQLADILPNSQPKRKFGGWGTNLSRSGVELALKLTKPGCICGIVSPMSLLGDQVSFPLREWLFSEAVPYVLDYYPAEARLFNDVDQDTISICFRKLQHVNFEYVSHVFDKHKTVVSTRQISVSSEVLKFTDYCLPVKDGDLAFHFFNKWQAFKTVEDLLGNHESGAWIGRELDETSFKEFIVNEGRYKFLKGRMIGRFEVGEPPKNYVSEELKPIPVSASYYRIVWRDVSRRSQIRRMQATIVPPEIVTGNSLNILYFRDNDIRKLQILLAIMNSIPFEFQVKSLLGTGHISASVVKKIHIPNLADNPYLNRIPDYFDGLSLKSPTLEPDLEILVAKAYNLDRVEYEKIIHTQEGIPTAAKSDLLTRWGIVV